MCSSASVRVRALTGLASLALLAMLAFGAAQASAAPQEPTLGLARLQELLAGSPAGVPGFFKTVLKGDVITEIPCAVLGVVPGSRGDGGDLIVFQASGPDIDAIGGIAHGMSGSPLYVQDGGQWMVIGAVSYGDVFTSGGLGLATPIEDMMAMETDYPAAGTVTLAAPLLTSSGPVMRVRFADAAKPVRSATSTRTFRPLATMSVTGLPKDSYIYRELEKRMSAAGVTLVAGLAGGGAEAGSFETALVPGASVGALVTRGSVAYGGIGTITYTTADAKVAAFGHPFGPITFTYPAGDGTSAYYLTNADVIAMWGSSYDPYKVAVPGAVRGTVSLDSPVGILGTIGASPAEAVVTSSATTNGGPERTSVVDVTQACADDPLNTYLMASLTYPGIYQSAGDGAFSGTLDYTLDIVVSDSTRDYTIRRDSVWDSTTDAPFMATVEQMMYFDKLLADPYGIAACAIKSVTMHSTLSATHRRASVSGISVPGGLHTGANTVYVTLYPYGSSQPLDVPATLTIPKGSDPRSGYVYAAAPDTGVVDEGGGWFGLSDPIDGWSGETPRRTLGDLVAAINAIPMGDQLQVVWDNGEGGDWQSEQRPWSASAVIGSTDTGSFLTGIVERQTSRLQLRAASPGAAGPSARGGRHALLAGTVSPAGGDTIVHITSKIPGGTSRFVADVPATTVSSDSYLGKRLSFAHEVAGLRHTTVFTATWDGDEVAIGATGTCRVKVKALVSLSQTGLSGSRTKLTAAVRPADCGGAVAFERRTAGGWVRIGKMALDGRGHASMTWKALAGATPVRAHFLGSPLNTAAVSRAIIVR